MQDDYFKFSNLQFPVQKSDIQIKLEQQGCIFNGQEPLSNHELDLSKQCYCGRPGLVKQETSK